MTRLATRFAAAALAALASGAACASTDPVYGSPGTVNGASYTFEAIASGHVYGYWLSSDASYSETLGMASANSTTALGATGLPNHGGTRGDSIDLGQVSAGDIVTFFIHVSTTGLTFSSQVDLNGDNSQHIYATGFAGDGAIPGGVWIGFEDLVNGSSDHDYNDTAFVVTNVAVVPEPGNVALLLAGLGVLATLARRRRAP